jgi:hypothetical protein
LVLAVMLQGKVLELLTLVHLFPSVGKCDLVREVGGLAVAQSQSNATCYKTETPQSLVIVLTFLQIIITITSLNIQTFAPHNW